MTHQVDMDSCYVMYSRCMEWPLTIAVHSYQLTLAFMPSSGVDVEIVIHPKPWAFLDNSLEIGFLGEVLEVLPCHVVGKTDPSMVQGNNCL